MQAKLSQTWINSELEKSMTLQFSNRRNKNQDQILAMQVALRHCYRTQVLLVTAQKNNTCETSIGWKGKVAFIRKPETWREGRLVSQTNSEDSAWPWQFLKGKKFSESSGQEIGLCVIFHFVQTAWLLVSFLQMLYCLSDLPAWLLRGLLGVES